MWTSQPNTGNNNKRFCTLNDVCFRPTGEQPKLAIIFRGKGKRLSAVEKLSWDKDVDVYFQKNAWAETVLSWLVKEDLQSNSYRYWKFYLFPENLEAHVQKSFRNSIKDRGGITWFGVPNATDIWQPVDGGYAATLKTLTNQKFSNWLDDEDNVEKWFEAESRITASEKRILITKWAGNAYRQLNRPSHDKFRQGLFQKTDCLITADSSDDKINPGLPNYKVPPPIMLDPWTALPASSIITEKDSNDTENEDILDDFEDENEMDNVEFVAEDVINSDG